MNTDSRMNVPRNVFWFEVLLYLSLTLDALSVAFQDRTPTAEMTEQMITAATVMAAGMILLLVYFVWLAAQRRKSWPRWVLLAALVLSVYSLVETIGDSRPATRQRDRDRVLRADGGGAVLLLHRRRQGLVQRLIWRPQGGFSERPNHGEGQDRIDRRRGAAPPRAASLG